jgi:hypothetical protein
VVHSQQAILIWWCGTPAIRCNPATGFSICGLPFLESDLPIRVDVMDWARIPPAFRQEIERGYVVVQAATEPTMHTTG